MLGASLVATAALAGCGGGPDALSRGEAVREANALCRAAAARMADATGPSTLAKIRGLAGEKARLHAGLAELSLGGPSQPVADYVAAYEREVEATKKVVDAVERTASLGSAESSEALAAESRAQNDAVSAADRAGLRDCGPRIRDATAVHSPVGLGTAPRVTQDGNAVIPGSAFVGTWEGTALQIEPGKQTQRYPVYFRIDPNVKEDGGNGGVRYDSFDCLGRVRIYEAGAGPDGFGYRYRLKETILTRRDVCGAGGTIVAVTEGDELDWRWKQRDIEVVAVLHLRDAPKRPPVAEDAMRELQGHDYSGTVTQYGPDDEKTSYPMRFGLYPPGSGNVDGYTQYSQPDCLGELTFVRGEGDRAVLRERITQGECIDGGEVETRRIGDKLLFRWFADISPGKDDQLRKDNVVLGTLSQVSDEPTHGPAPG